MKKLLLPIAVLIVFVGCGGEKDIFPITVGNTWEYDHISTHGEGDSILWSDTTSTTMTISRETTLNNGTAVFEAITEGDTWKDSSYLEQTDDYVVSYDSLGAVIGDTLLKFPIEQGNSWTIYSDSNSTSKAVVVGKKNVSVPAGTYDDCWEIGVYWTWNPDDTVYMYYAPGVGLVRQYLSFVDSTSWAVHETQLVETNIK
ncbi:MAG: hypothetical protein ABIL22_01045 [candidate division WOR-3 bacterium]